MKSKTMKEEFIKFQWILMALFTVCLGSCKDDKDAASTPYDPSQPVVVTDFTPKAGGAKLRMIIYGSNFGTDTSIVSVKVGGKESVIVSAKGNSLYCITPEQCYRGTIEVKVGEQSVVASEKYEYVPQMVVSTLCGHVDDLGNGDIVPNGPFNDCGKIDYPTWFSFDPQNPNMLYLSQDNGNANKPLRVLDLDREWISSISVTDFGITRIRSISWTKEGEMVIACPRNDVTAASNVILYRDGGFTTRRRLTKSRACNASMIHPITGELYYNLRAQGNVFKFNFYEKAFETNSVAVTNNEEFLFNVPDAQSNFSFVPHPSGNYVYIIMHERHYILRANYDHDTNRLVTPYIVCGKSGESGYADLVGTSARLDAPGQGVFVYNEEYEKAGREDHYDFYFTDANNHCIRILTQDGVVSTFAGRGSAGANLHKYGYINGALRETARFNNPIALAYHEETRTFYVGDVNNHRIRKIAMEEIPEDDADNQSGGDE